MFKLMKCFYDDALMELGSHYAHRTLFVSCTRDYTYVYVHVNLGRRFACYGGFLSSLYVVSVRRGFLFLLKLIMGCVILL